MKIIPYLLAATLAAPAAETPLPVGSVSANQTFAVRNGSSFVDTSLDAYEGKILVIMMQTPWCPTCITNGAAVGSGILSHFNAPSRGGKNQHGIEIDSVMLSVEPASQWDPTTSDLAATAGYEQWGLDANAQRQNPRVMLGYYRGGFPGGVNHSNLYNWGNDRRRVVVLNLVRDSASHAYRQIVINQNSFDSSNYEAAQGLINAIKPAPLVTTYATWAAGFSFPSGESDPGDDPDHDGSPNGIEAFLGTHPRQGGSRSLPTAALNTSGGNHLEYSFQRTQSVPSGLIIEVQVSSSLGSGSWTTIKQMINGAWSGAATLAEGPPAGGLIPVTVQTASSAGLQQFVRLLVKQS